MATSLRTKRRIFDLHRIIPSMLNKASNFDHKYDISFSPTQYFTCQHLDHTNRALNHLIVGRRRAKKIPKKICRLWRPSIPRFDEILRISRSGSEESRHPDHKEQDCKTRRVLMKKNDPGSSRKKQNYVVRGRRDGSLRRFPGETGFVWTSNQIMPVYDMKVGND